MPKRQCSRSTIPTARKRRYSDGRIQSWSAFEAALQPRLAQARAKQGAGLALLTGRVTSPTLVAQIAELTKSLPEAKWYRYEPVEDDAVRNGAILAFGRPAAALPRFADARVVLALDADPLGAGPAQIRFAREIIGARQSHVAEQSLRLYAVEPAWTLTGALPIIAWRCGRIDPQCRPRGRTRARRGGAATASAVRH